MPSLILALFLRGVDDGITHVERVLVTFTIGNIPLRDVGISVQLEQCQTLNIQSEHACLYQQCICSFVVSIVD